MAKIYFKNREKYFVVNQSAKEITDVLKKNRSGVDEELYATGYRDRPVIIFLKEVQFITD